MDSLKDPKFDILFDNLLNNPNFILFSGAGTSYYTGMPTGKELSEKLFDKVKKYGVDKKNWQETSQKIVDIYDRSELNKILKEIFNTERVLNKKYHDMLIDNIMLKNIYTLNYDDLFEKENSDKIKVIYEPSQIPEQDDKRINIIKLHGDLRANNTIILTRNDYQKFTKDIGRNPFIREFEVEARKSIIVVCGVSFADKHFKEIFNHLNEQLGECRKKVFYITPTLSDSLKEICKELNFTPIESTFEEFVQWTDNFYKENMPNIKEKVSRIRLEKMFPIVEINNEKINLDLSINQRTINISGVDQINNFQRFINGEIKEIKFSDIGLKNKYEDILINEISNCDAVMMKAPDFYFNGRLICDSKALENSIIEIFRLKTPQNNSSKVEIKINFNEVVFTLDVYIKNEKKINNNIEVKAIVEYKLNSEKIKESIDYYLGIEKIIELLTCKQILLKGEKDIVIDTKHFSELLKDEEIIKFLHALKFQMKYCKPITDKTILEYNDFGDEKKQELVILELMLKGESEFPPEAFEEICFYQKNIEIAKKKIENLEKMENFVMTRDKIFNYKKKYLKFIQTMSIKQFSIDAKENNLIITPLSNVKENWELIDQWVED